jgi:hypothetical protein
MAEAVAANPPLRPVASRDIFPLFIRPLRVLVLPVIAICCVHA